MDKDRRIYKTEQPLSQSCKQATQYAMLRAKARNEEYASSVDVLAGIVVTHSGNTEPLQLLEYAGVSLEEFIKEYAMDDFSIKADDWENAPPLIPDKEVRKILTYADKLALEYNPESNRFIRIPDLFGGLLLTDNTASALIAKALVDNSLSFDAVRASYPEYVKLPSSRMSYADFLGKHHPQAHQLFSGYDSDAPSEKDLVGIGPEVNAMAYLVSAKTLIPPLAIGLFGDWGSGKSFFIQALKRRIHKITADARSAKKRQGDIDIFKYVVQIEFNAWHYVEGELWASLVEHILRNLQLGTEDSETELQLRKKHWIERLRIARQDEEDIRNLKSRLKSELESTKLKIRSSEEDLEKTRRELERLTIEDVWGAVVVEDADKAEVREVADTAGLGSVGESAAELFSTLEESSSILRRSNALLAPLKFSGWRGAVWVGALLLVMFVGPVVTLILSEVVKLPQFTEAFTTLGGFLATLAGAVAAGNAWIRKWLNKAEDAKRRLNAKRDSAENKLVHDIAELRTLQIEQIEELQVVREQGQRKRREIRELEQELDGLTPGRVLLDFINERVGSEDYRKHLGVAALIRRDFEKLSDLIIDGNREFEDKDTGEVTSDDEHRINRIVLYIDDLDRCPPERVVEVLQAVHLLLAFPLFVVVVAVDARWLEQSLRGHYEKLLVADGQDISATTAQATPQDYLEKIFQIPFWVKPLPETARVRIVQNLVAKSLVLDKNGEDFNNGNKPSINSSTPTEHVQWYAEEPERPLKRDEKTEFHPRGLEIRNEELMFMQDLKTILGASPRSVKRFVNIYRLIKASAIAGGSNFVDEGPDADFRVVLFLLAVVTGLPHLSRRFFATVTTATYQSPQTATIDVLTKSLEGKSSNHTHEEPREKTDLERLKQWIATYQEGRWKDVKVKSLAAWAPRVARFSYRIEVF